MIARRVVARPGHRSLFQPAEPAFWVFAAFVAYGLARLAAALSDLSGIASSGWALAWVLVALYALPAFVLVYALDLYEREPVSLVLGGLRVGRLRGHGPVARRGRVGRGARRARRGRRPRRSLGPVIVAPVVEESMKGGGHRAARPHRRATRSTT